MTIRATIPALIACAALAGAGAANAQITTNAAGSIGAGAAAATNSGAIAGGTSAAGALNSSTTAKSKHDKHRDSDRAARGGAATAPVNSATTYGSGAVYTDRNSTSAGVTAGGAAAGSGVNSSSTSVGAYGETGKTGTNADVYGDSAATSGASR